MHPGGLALQPGELVLQVRGVGGFFGGFQLLYQHKSQWAMATLSKNRAKAKE
jgi:hypothetical protein